VYGQDLPTAGQSECGTGDGQSVGSRSLLPPPSAASGPSAAWSFAVESTAESAESFAESSLDSVAPPSRGPSLVGADEHRDRKSPSEEIATIAIERKRHFDEDLRRRPEGVVGSSNRVSSASGIVFAGAALGPSAGSRGVHRSLPPLVTMAMQSGTVRR
jgi:hypothetical protein